MIFFRRNLLFSYLTIAPTNILTKFSSVVVLLWKANSVLPLACLCSGPTTTTTLKKSSLCQTSLSLCSLVFPLPKRKPKITFQLFFTFGCNYSNFLPNNAFCRVGQLSFVCLCLCVLFMFCASFFSLSVVRPTFFPARRQTIPCSRFQNWKLKHDCFPENSTTQGLKHKHVQVRIKR